MTSWIVSVCGIAILSLLIDVILPDGKTQKYVRSVVAVVLTFVMLLPISKLFANVDMENVFFESEMTIQQSYIDGIEEQNNLARMQRVQLVISKFDIENPCVTLQPNGYVCLKVQCDRQVLQQIQRELSAIESKIMILWSDSSEQN